MMMRARRTPVSPVRSNKGRRREERCDDNYDYHDAETDEYADADVEEDTG